MKIAFVSQDFDRILPSEGGADTSIAIWTQQVGQRLVAMGHQVVIYSNQPYMRGQKKIEQQGGIEYRGMPGAIAEGRLARLALRFMRLYQKLEKRLGMNSPQKPTFASRFYHVEYSLQVALDLRSQGSDIVHIHHFTQYISIIRLFNPGIKVVLSTHCDWLNELDQKMLLGRLRHADLVMSSSEYLTRRSSQRFPEIRDRFVTVYNGVDMGRFTKSAKESNTDTPDHPPRLLYVGRVSPEKGVHVLVEAFHKVAAKFPDAELKIVGPIFSAPYEYMAALYDDEHVTALDVFYDPEDHSDGGLYYAHLKRCLEPDLIKQTTFAGAQPYAEIAEHYREADVFVFPSVCHEGFGIPVIEAMLNNIPVVGTRSGGVQETIQDGITGLLVGRSNADALADAVNELLADDQRRAAMGAAGYQRASTQFTWDQSAENALKFYQQILAK